MLRLSERLLSGRMSSCVSEFRTLKFALYNIFRIISPAKNCPLIETVMQDENAVDPDNLIARTSRNNRTVTAIVSQILL